MPEDNYDEEYVILTLAEQVELNLKYGQFFRDQSKRNKCIFKKTSKVENCDKFVRENFYHWEATREIMDINRRRNNSPETRRLVEQRNALSWPGTLRRRYDYQVRLRFLLHPGQTNVTDMKSPKLMPN